MAGSLLGIVVVRQFSLRNGWFETVCFKKPLRSPQVVEVGVGDNVCRWCDIVVVEKGRDVLPLRFASGSAVDDNAHAAVVKHNVGVFPKIVYDKSRNGNAA